MQIVRALIGFVFIACLAPSLAEECNGTCATSTPSFLQKGLARRSHTQLTEDRGEGEIRVCAPAMVRRACGEIAGDRNRTEVTLTELVDAVGADISSGVNLLKALGMDADNDIICPRLCANILNAIPPTRRPPRHDVAAQLSECGLVWDINVSSVVIATIHIPERQGDEKEYEEAHGAQTLAMLGTQSERGAKQLGNARNKARHPQDGGTNDAYVPERKDVEKMVTDVAELFRLYPGPMPPKTCRDKGNTSNTSDTLLEASTPIALVTSAGQCGREAIWGLGDAYIGCQSTTRSGKQCRRWTRSPSEWGSPPSSWLRSNKNWCRNPDQSMTIWCWTGSSLSDWEFCEPLDKKDQTKSAPKDFLKVASEATEFAKAFLTLAIDSWTMKYLPPGYETWMGPSEARSVYGRTEDGCACKKEWTHGGARVTDYCGNPDGKERDWCYKQHETCSDGSSNVLKSNAGCVCNSACENTDGDPNGPWCFIDENACEGRNTNWDYCSVPEVQTQAWGYCVEPKTVDNCACEKDWTYQGKQVRHCGNPDNDAKGPWCLVKDASSCGTDWGYCKELCGDSCKRVRQVLLDTRDLLANIGFEWEGSEGAYAYVSGVHTQIDGGRFPVDPIGTPGSSGMTSYSYTEENGVYYSTKMKTTESDHVGKYAIMTLCKAWWDECSAYDDLAKCRAKNPNGFGTLVGTIVHEAMHHFPIGADDYIYYRNNVKQWVKANRLSTNTMKLVKDCADCLEYFVEDINGYTETGR